MRALRVEATERGYSLFVDGEELCAYSSFTFAMVDAADFIPARRAANDATTTDACLPAWPTATPPLPASCGALEAGWFPQ